MENETQDGAEVLETQQTDEQQENAQDTQDETEVVSKSELAELKRKAEERDELEKKNKQLYQRTKKAEEKAPLQADGLSSKDVLFLAKADIHHDDLDEVLDWAKFKKIPVSEAYNQLKDTLTIRAEHRKTAEITQTKGSPRGTTKVTGEDLLKKAETSGEVPDTEDGLRQMALARLARKKSH